MQSVYKFVFRQFVVTVQVDETDKISSYNVFVGVLNDNSE